ncbi:MAG: myo-inosose-2 dehydratase [Planctomycetota bacterium]|jgi:inosose dehydratase|nr:myo-inosose-2 dehydratase [Planctomycetota bacterium]
MFKKGKVGLGIAPIGWTNDDMPDLGRENTFEQCLSEMALAGFSGTEIGNKYPRDPAALAKALSLRGLKIVNAWFSAYLTSAPYGETEREFVRQARFLKEIGAEFIGVSEQGHGIQGRMETPIFEARRLPGKGEWKKLASGLDRLGKIARSEGIGLVFHHHMGTAVQTGAETDRLLEGTNPDLVGLLFDSGHFAYSGEDPLPILKRHVSRVRHVHLKDIRPEVVGRVKAEKLSFLKGVRLGAFTVPGDGAIDFRPLFRTLADAGYQGWLLVEAEQDPAVANPLEYALKARKYIREAAGL